jgi:hypothetical protein
MPTREECRPSSVRGPLLAGKRMRLTIVYTHAACTFMGEQHG